MTDDAERTCAGMNLHGKDIKIFAGNSNKPLAAAMAECLGITLGRSEVGRFSDGEIQVSIQESVRGSDVYVVQSTSSPVNRNLMELLIMMDAFRRASAGRITAVIPYYGYARQDRKSRARDPITAKLVADLIVTAGADRVLTMDLHASQIQGFFDVPVDHMYGAPILTPYFARKTEPYHDNVTVVSPDLGSVARARAFAERLDVPLAIVDKRRPRANVSEVMNIIGEVEGRDVVIVDDMIDTAGTLCNAAGAIKARGAKSVTACATHGVLSGPAIGRIRDSALDEVVLLDTIALPPEKQIEKIKVLSVAPVLAEAGFDVAPFDAECVALRAIPTFFGENESPKELLLEALSEWQAGRGQVTRERLRRRVAQMACKHAIKGGDRLSDTEISGFLREMLKSEAMPTCPHGRPIVVEVTRYALEKRFKRIQ